MGGVGAGFSMSDLLVSLYVRLIVSVFKEVSPNFGDHPSSNHGSQEGFGRLSILGSPGSARFSLIGQIARHHLQSFFLGDSRQPSMIEMCTGAAENTQHHLEVGNPAATYAMVLHRSRKETTLGLLGLFDITLHARVRYNQNPNEALSWGARAEMWIWSFCFLGLHVTFWPSFAQVSLGGDIQH